MTSSTDRKPKVCLLGGYGNVGLRAAKLLHQKRQFDIILVGRDQRKATEAAHSIGPDCQGLGLDTKAPDALDQLKNYEVCLNLTEATPVSLEADLITNGTHIIDSSASPGYAADLRDAVNAQPSPEATCVLETGLAPGLTNLLAYKIVRERPDTCSVDVLIQMGMGVHHGLAATEWMLQSLGTSYPFKSGGQWQDEFSGHLTRYFPWSEELRIKGIGFGFSDQVSMARDFDLTQARTFLAVDPTWVTWLLQWLSDSLLDKLVIRHSKTVAKALLKLPKMGSPRTRLILEGRNASGELTQVEKLQGGPQSELTAIVLSEAVATLLRLTTDLPPKGIQPLHNLLDATAILEVIDQYRAQAGDSTHRERNNKDRLTASQ
ncbi:saccharopine dehydrogenase NADP-binding domain-containing protein [Hahella ganghwensis]|uniref:saccharopine dehydrogenase NADP-binding domain-containing protein n=1 Tax=Hahella ganghwensis TaxID=286420 RepID=UPI000364418D|nr:saccharopine dehydrogenase NADP-binding domain-containing protein [Hahella ganghwensis]